MKNVQLLTIGMYIVANKISVELKKDFYGKISYELKHLKYFQRIISRLVTERVGDYPSKHHGTRISE